MMLVHRTPTRSTTSVWLHRARASGPLHASTGVPPTWAPTRPIGTVPGRRALSLSCMARPKYQQTALKAWNRPGSHAVALDGNDQSSFDCQSMKRISGYFRTSTQDVEAFMSSASPNCMLLCPWHPNTSPKRTSLIVTVSVPHVRVILCGVVEAGRWGISISHLPLVSVAMERAGSGGDVPTRTTMDTVVAGVAVPQTRASMSRCSTACGPIAGLKQHAPAHRPPRFHFPGVDDDPATATKARATLSMRATLRRIL